MSADGQKRIGVAMVDPATPSADDDVDDDRRPLRSSRATSSRMVLVAGRAVPRAVNAGDVATASMAAFAGFRRTSRSC